MDERLLGAEPENISNLPRRIWAESKKIWRVAFPAMLARVTQFGMFVVTQAFIGHLGGVDLAAYALIQILTVRFVNGILVSIFVIRFFFLLLFDIWEDYICTYFFWGISILLTNFQPI